MKGREIDAPFVDAIYVEAKGEEAQDGRLFAMVDHDRSSTTHVIYTPGSLFRIEIHSLKSREDKSPVLVEMFAAHTQNTSGPLELFHSINRKDQFTKGKDIFICPGRSIGDFNQGMLTNNAERMEWQVFRTIKSIIGTDIIRRKLSW